MKDNRKNQIVVRLTDSEKQAIKISAVLKNTSVSNMIRKSLLK